jgi:hypothetical protein
MCIETVEEYLARGGNKIVVPSAVIANSQKIGISPSNTTTIIDLDEGAQFYSDFKIKTELPKKIKSNKAMDKKDKDFSNLPSFLRDLIKQEIGDITDTLNSEN